MKDHVIVDFMDKIVKRNVIVLTAVLAVQSLVNVIVRPVGMAQNVKQSVKTGNLVKIAHLIACVRKTIHWLAITKLVSAFARQKVELVKQ